MSIHSSSLRCGLRAANAVWAPVQNFRAKEGQQADVTPTSTAFVELVEECNRQLLSRELLYKQAGLLQVADKHLHALTDCRLSQHERDTLLAGPPPEEEAEGPHWSEVAVGGRVAYGDGARVAARVGAPGGAHAAYLRHVRRGVGGARVA